MYKKTNEETAAFATEMAQTVRLAMAVVGETTQMIKVTLQRSQEDL